MEDKEGDWRVPIISSIFCISVIIGGILLIFYLFVPHLSQPWFPPVALILIGSPWLFWFLMYMYTCIKRCCSSSKLESRQISRHSSRVTSVANPGMARNASKANSTSSENNNNDEKRVKFAGAVEVATESGHSHGSQQDGGDASINSYEEIEIPLASSIK